MENKQIMIGGLIGFVVTFILGYLFYGVLLSDFFSSNAGSATGVMRAEDDMQWLPLILGHVALGFLLAIILGRWANISTFKSGFMAGALIGFLVSAAHNLIMYATTNISNLNGALADIVVSTVILGIGAGVVAVYYGSAKK